MHALFALVVLIWFGLVGCTHQSPGSRSVASLALPSEYKNCSAESLAQYDRCHETRRRAPYYLVHEGERRQAALLIHGLSDGPFMNKDIAWELYQQGYNVLVPLMPGHGHETAQGVGLPEGLHNVKWSDWTTHIAQNVLPLLDEMGEERLLIGGLSNGGILTVHTVLTMPPEMRAKVRGLLLYSPIIALPQVVLTRVLSDLAISAFTCDKEGFMADVPYLGGGESFRYMLMSKNGVCQAHQLIQESDVGDHYREFENIPVFGVLSEDDAAIDQSAFIRFMERTGGGKNKFVILSNKKRASIIRSAERALSGGQQRRINFTTPASQRCEAASASDCVVARLDDGKVYVSKSRYVDHAGVTLSHRAENLRYVDRDFADRVLNPYYEFTQAELRAFLNAL